MVYRDFWGFTEAYKLHYSLNNLNFSLFQFEGNPMYHVRKPVKKPFKTCVTPPRQKFKDHEDGFNRNRQCWRDKFSYLAGHHRRGRFSSDFGRFRPWGHFGKFDKSSNTLVSEIQDKMDIGCQNCIVTFAECHKMSGNGIRQRTRHQNSKLRTQDSESKVLRNPLKQKIVNNMWYIYTHAFIIT